MHGVLLQEMIGIGNDSSIATQTQGEEFWLNTGPYQDAIFWIECRGVGVGPYTGISLSIETSPVKEDAYFLPVFAPFQLSAGTAPIFKLARMSDGNATYPPIANWLRWRVSGMGTPSGSTPWLVSFRIYVTLNSPGM